MAEESQGKRYVVGVDLGGTKILVAGMDGDHTILSRTRVPTDPKEGTEAVVDRIGWAVSQVVKEMDISSDDVAGIGVGAPGPLDPETGVVTFAPNLNWNNVPLKAMLEARLSVPVFVENDVNVGVLGEHRLGAGRGMTDLIGVFVGTGIGGGVIIGGKLYQGYNRSAGEVGHMVVRAGGPRCGCGNRGCWEAVASRTAIVRRIAKAFRKGEKGWLYRKIAGNPSQVKSRALSRALAKGDPLVVREMKREARYLGIGVANLVNLFSPRMVILGGGVVEAMEMWLIKQVRRHVLRYALDHAMADVEIVPAALGDDAGILGCAVLVEERLRG